MDMDSIQSMVMVGSAAFVVILTIYFILAQREPTKGLTREYQPFKLVKKTNVSHNVIMFRFALPDPKSVLGLAVGQHMLLKATTDGEEFSRPYTPVTSNDDVGYFELVIKIYPGGKMGQFLKHLPIGGTVLARGPVGHLRYNGQGQFAIKRKGKPQQLRSCKRVGLIAGGTGITPMLQIVRDVAKRFPTDSTKLSLIFANVTEDDILLKDELDELQEKFSNIKVYLTLDKPPADWTMGSGFVSTAMIKTHLPEPADDSIILICGPPGMTRAMEGNLAKLGYSEEQYFVY